MLALSNIKRGLNMAILAIAAITLSLSCEEKDNTIPPRVLTASVDEITSNSAVVGGNVTHDGGSTITERGIYWSTEVESEKTGQKLAIGSDKGIFYETLSGLTPGVKYYVRAFATNSKGTTFGNETFFTTAVSLPTVTTANAEPVSPTSVTLGGEVTNDGGFPVSERGLFWGTSANTQNTGKKEIIGSGNGAFNLTLSNLTQGVTYYARAYARNVKGMSLGNEISFSTVIVEPTVVTQYPDEVTTSSAILKGEVESNGGASISSKGFYWGTQSQVQSTGTRVEVDGDADAFSQALDNLSPGTSYYYIAFATNSTGTAYGEERTFTTLGSVPEAKTEGYKELKTNSVKLLGIVSANSLSTTIRFEYGTSSSYGTTVNSANTPTTQNSYTDSVVITGLSPNTTYHFRVVAQNQMGTTYGRDTTFKTVLTGITGSVFDIDGNAYSTVGIGYQYWITENLRVTKLNDGTPIAYVVKDSLWREIVTPGYSWYSNDSLMAAQQNYGALYNWYTVNTSKLCPSGWRVPTADDVTELLDYLGGANIAGGLLKTTGTSQWQSPNKDAANANGFNARPAGKRGHDALFDFIGLEGNWWSNDEYSTHTSLYFYLQYNYGNAYQANINKRTGLSVRCVKD